MGVPKFFKWLTDNTLNYIFDEKMQVENLFIDANCAIHPCCHPPESTKNEEEMFTRVCDYLLKLINVSKPTELVILQLMVLLQLQKLFNKEC